MKRHSKLLSRRSTTNRLQLPLKIFVIYILGTLSLNLFGPWDYIGMNKQYVTIYILFFLLTTIVTYSTFSKLRIPTIRTRIKKIKFLNDGKKITKISLLLTLLLLGAMVVIKIIELGIPDIDNIFLSMAAAYTSKGVSAASFNLSAWLFNYFSIFYMIAIILGTYYFTELNWKYRTMYSLSIFLSLFYHVVFVGNQKAIADIVIYISSVMFIKFCKTGRKVKTKSLVSLAVGGVLLLIIFANVLYSRMDLWGVEYYSIGGKAYLNPEHWSLYLFTDKYRLGIGTLFFYLSAGYYGLSLTLSLPFVWSQGYGSSFALRDIFNRFWPMPDSIIASYPVRMEESTGWQAYANWHTIFPWLASDFTFIGAIFIANVFVVIYVISWKKILNNGNWTNVLLIALLNIFFIYVPANNQLFQTRTSLVATILVFLLWLFNNGYELQEENYG